MLIKIDVNDNQEQVISARELYEFLEVKSRFNDWFKRRVNKYEFEENIDYIAITQKRVTAQNNSLDEMDYILKLDMAKELCMIENNEKGREARKYFIECEKQLKKNSKIEFNPELQFIQERINRIRVLEEQYRSIIEQLKYEYEMIGSRSTIMQMQLNDLRGPLHLRKALGNIVYNPPK